MSSERVGDHDLRCRRSYHQVLKEASQFFTGQGDVYRTLLELAHRLGQKEISYAIIGAMALAQHGLVRVTQAVAVLLTPEGLRAFREHCLGRGYLPAFPGANKTFRDTQTQVTIEVVTTGEYPGDGLPKPVAFPDPDSASLEQEGIRVVTLENLVQLKLASGMTAAHRLRDLADVQDLIAALDLPLEFAERLDTSVRGEYERLWRTVHAAGEKQE